MKFFDYLLENTQCIESKWVSEWEKENKESSWWEHVNWNLHIINEKKKKCPACTESWWFIKK